MSNIEFEVRSILEILSRKGLNIPNYQRPYKWERKHIRNLYYDIREAINRNTSDYRIGTVILHNKSEKELDIVDGQQRLISIALLLLVVNKDSLPVGAKNLLSREYSGISQNHAKENYNEWSSLCNLISDSELYELSYYILNKCKVSVIEMPEDKLAEAFQLFDSQNNRGKKLEVHDLLKAYHLRAIGSLADETTVEKWEKYNDIEAYNGLLNLEQLFDKHLFRIRRWANGETGLTKRKNSNTSELKFTANYIDDFKGVDLNKKSYPYLKLYEELKEHGIDFPNSLCMPIINGDSFFKYIEYSYELFNKNFYEDNITRNYLSDEIYSFVTSKVGKYSRNINLFINLIALFQDRFGSEALTREINEKIFVWAFYPRVMAKYIGDSMQANYAAGEKFLKNPAQKLFHLLASSATPNDFISKINTDLFQNYTSNDIISRLNDQGGNN
ncbi:DUF262 domain-containing protein [Clostridium perfringens]